MGLPDLRLKIQERRRLEVAAAVIYSASIDRSAVMVSYTFPHRFDQPLALLLRLQADAIKHLRGSRGYMAAMLRISNAGRIRSLEVTHGQNGWHPHTHELLFVDPKMPAEWLRNELANLWLKACTKVGLFRPGLDDEAAFLRHSVDVRAGDSGVADYLAKLDDQSSGQPPTSSRNPAANRASVRAVIPSPWHCRHPRPRCSLSTSKP